MASGNLGLMKAKGANDGFDNMAFDLRLRLARSTGQRMRVR